MPLVRGDADRLKQVLWNLLGNAIKFTPAGGTVSVRMAFDNAGVTVSIHDTGPGIAPALLPHIFDAFRQGEEHSRSGLGLGLAIARQLVELHGGTIEATTGVDGGATFVMCIPASIAGAST